MQAGTASFLAYHAAARPEAAALVQDGVPVTYSRFYADANRMTRVLAGFGLQPGAIVVVESGDDYLHWLILLACEGLGLLSASFSAKEESPAALLAQAALVLHGEPLAVPVAASRRLDQAFLDEVRAAAPTPPPRPALSWRAGRRIRRSSGTTGTAKLMVSTAAAQEADIVRNLYATPGLTSESRVLLFNQFWIGAFYHFTIAALRMGARIIIDRRGNPAAALREYRPTHLRALVAELPGVLRGLPADFVKPDRLVVLSGGAELTESLRRTLLERVASEVIHTYSTNETVRIGAFDDAGVATLYPGVRLEILDEAGQPVGPDQAGAVRVRTPTQSDGYLDDPEATRRLFRDGWFHPGDLAQWVAPRRLRLVGRSDDLINLGHGKLLPASIEATVREAADVAEVAVTALRNQSGTDEVCIALVLAPGQDRKAVTAAIAARLPRYLGPVRLRVVRALPRGLSGKVPREALRALFDAG
jgi:acyl-CoA synthetase (AMP-forming)/AMP-acid ligase II